MEVLFVSIHRGAWVQMFVGLGKGITEKQPRIWFNEQSENHLSLLVGAIWDLSISEPGLKRWKMGK